MMNERIEFKPIISTNKFPELHIGEIIWVDKYNDSEDDFMRVPLRVLRIFNDGSWDGELDEAEA